MVRLRTVEDREKRYVRGFDKKYIHTYVSRGIGWDDVRMCTIAWDRSNGETRTPVAMYNYDLGFAFLDAISHVGIEMRVYASVLNMISCAKRYRRHPFIFMTFWYSHVCIIVPR